CRRSSTRSSTRSRAMPRPRDERGSAAVEFALVLPLLLMVALSLVEVGLLSRDRLLVEAAARAGARAAAVEADEGAVRDDVVVAGMIVLTLALAVGAADVGRALVAQARARTAADAAALAAAQELAIPGGRAPAEIAAEYASRNDGHLLSCTCDVGTLEAVVEV